MPEEKGERPRENPNMECLLLVSCKRGKKRQKPLGKAGIQEKNGKNLKAFVTGEGTADTGEKRGKFRGKGKSSQHPELVSIR